MLLPRMLLHRPPGTRTLSKSDWRARIAHFQQNEWTLLLRQGGVHTDTEPGPSLPEPPNTEVPPPAVQQHGPEPTVEQRGRRARQLTHQGELSAARQALTTGPLAPHTQATLQELRDPSRRPPEPYQDFPAPVQEFQPAHPPNLPATQLLTNLRRARKGAAPGPSGYTSEVLRLVLDDEGTTNQFVAVATRIANADLPPQISQALGLGRIVALQKPNGRVRGIVVGDLFRRLVARCLAQTYAPQIHATCKPHQLALSTRAGTEAIVHALTAAAESNPTHTILSVDGIGAYDTISRASMLQGLLAVPEANCCLPFVRQFYTTPSTYIWHDATGQPHPITQAEGGEQGDPLMPALFSLGQRAALQSVQAELEAGETIFAFLDDIYCILPPERVRPVYDLLAHHLHAQAHIRLNSGKTRIWNASGQQPPNIGTLGPAVWVGNTSHPRHEQGLTVLGAPIGTTEYKQHQLQLLRIEHDKLLQQLPHLQDLQASWLLLLYCASPRCIYQLRMLPPDITAQFSQDHDTAVAACLSELLDAGPIPATSLAIAHLPLSQGGLGLTSASVTANPIYWASWADTLPVLHNQLPQHAETLLHQLQHPAEAPPAVHAALTAANHLQEHGYDVPEWEPLATGRTQSPPQPSTHGPTHHRGWQHGAVHAYHTSFETSLQDRLDPASQALLASQQGPHASRSFTTIPYNIDTEYPTHLFRILILRRLRLPIPLTARHCRCRRTLDTFGDHRAACAQSGILRNRSTPLERATARMCREAGARATTNTLLTNLNLDHIHRQDDRRIEVIANGLPVWGGAQLAVDTTIVSPLTREGQPRRRAGQYAGTALMEARRRKERTYPELLHSRRCRLVVLGIETGGRWSEEAARFVTLLAHAKARQAPHLLQHSVAAALINRWTAMLTHAALQAFAASLLDPDCAHLTNVEGNDPAWSQLLAEAPGPLPAPSRLPASR